MSRRTIRTVLRLLILVLLQILVFRHVQVGSYGHFFLYPLGLLLLPTEWNVSLVMVVGFFAGLIVDWFYGSLGVQAASMVLLAFVRPWILRLIAPATGYSTAVVPVASRMGLLWYLRYVGIGILVFIFSYYLIEAFSLVYFYNVLLKTTASWLLSLVLILLHQMIFNPSY